MAQEWTKPPEDTELQDVEQPVGSDDDLDDGGYDATDDPASREPAGSLPPSRDPGRGPTSYPVAPAAIPAWVKEHGNGEVPLDQMIKVAPISTGDTWFRRRPRRGGTSRTQPRHRGSRSR